MSLVHAQNEAAVGGVLPGTEDCQPLVIFKWV